MKNRQKDHFTKQEWSWIFYDWANSVYATNIMAAIFPTIFVSVVNRAGSAGDQWWGYGTSIATLIVAILAPLLGAIADYKGMKKKLFTAFMLTGVVFTAMIAVTSDWKLMLVGYIFSHIGFSGSCLFYDSFLTDITTNERMDKVSSWGFAMGYIGGSTIPFVASIGMLLALGNSSVLAQKFSILITSLWWLGFSIPFLKNVRQEHYIERTQGNSIRQTFQNILQTARDIFVNRSLFFFIIAYFFYIDGVGTVITISTAYGTTLGLGTVGMILALLVTQIVAMPCSIGFSRLAGKFGARRALTGAIIVYTFICVVGFYMGFSLEPRQDSYNKAMADSGFTDTIGSFQGGAGFADAKAFTAGYEDFKDGIKPALLSADPGAALEKLTLKVEGVTAAETASVTYPADSAALTGLSDGEKLTIISGTLKTAARAFAAGNSGVLNGLKSAIKLSTTLFWMMAFLVGTVQGGIQAVSRSYLGKLVPKERSNEFFGFFEIFGKFATVIGPLLYALTGGLTGRSSYGVLCLIVLFVLGYVFLSRSRKYLA
jgi:MFS transporter, UMF1 family